MAEEKDKSILVDGKTVEEFLNEQERDDIKEEYQKATTKMPASKGKLKPYQTYDRTPGEVKHYTKEDIEMMGKNQEYAQRMTILKEQLKAELKMDRPNRSKVILYHLALEKNWSTRELTRHVNDLLAAHGHKTEIIINSMASWFSSIPQLKKPIGEFIIKRHMDNVSQYRLLPSMYNLSLEDMYQLTRPTGIFSPRDALLRVPALKEEQKEYNKFLITKKDLEEEEKPIETEFQKRVEEKVKAEEKPEQEEFIEAITTLPRELTLKVKVEIPPIKILFGWDR